MASAKIQEAVELLKKHDDGFVSPILPPDDDVIQYVEGAIGLKLPTDYRYLVQNAGHIVLSKELLYLRADGEGRCNIIPSIATARESGVPNDWLPICRDNGDYYCLLPDGSVELWSHDQMFEGRWSDLSDWVVDSFVNGN
ncbi:SMI1/KNR4 family protein [Aliirhizobium terrae]|uniref:SMI1/KNR4 family protein n=1 Tax=Terrirhizobium terrae TaxID=2926709 RepID=UPI0025764A76|nr:SMI1/KNR4 family protein [Rhizobium sp. CC-CFT758]WJH40207.1 SMI1/KNR4 family protein [Rhizobium sp. CC-CFT758]